MKIALKQIHPNPLQPRHKKPDVSDLVKSMGTSEIGLVQPIVVAKDGTGYVVIAGHRRWTAAVMLKWEDIECVVVEITDPKLDIGRIMAENEARSDLSGAERAAGYQTMIELGWDDTAIQALSGTSLPEVTAARQIAKLSKKSIAKMPAQATLVEMAGLAEFENDPSSFETLSRIVGTNNFLHQLQRHRDDKARKIKFDEAIAQITKLGQRFVPREKTYDTAVKLDHPKIKQSVVDHSKCPGHCATVNYDGRVEYMCDKPSEHGIVGQKPAAKDLALDRRKRQMRVLWRASAPVRQEYVKTQLTAGVKLSPDMLKFALTWVNAIGCPAFNAHNTKSIEYTKATALDTRFAATCVAQAEDAIFGWVKFQGAIGDPGYHGCVRDYLKTLAKLGYPISDHEKAVVDGTDYTIPEEPITPKPGSKVLDPVPVPGPGQTAIPVSEKQAKKAS